MARPTFLPGFLTSAPLLVIVVNPLQARTASFAVGSSLTLEEIVAAKDFSLAEASRPAFGDLGVGFTVIIAIIATASGLLASVFAVSRMLAMLTDMKLIPHRHFGIGPRTNIRAQMAQHAKVNNNVHDKIIDRPK